MALLMIYHLKWPEDWVLYNNSHSNIYFSSIIASLNQFRSAFRKSLMNVELNNNSTFNLFCNNGACNNMNFNSYHGSNTFFQYHVFANYVSLF